MSQGCKFCYAEVMALRLNAMGVEKYRNGFNVAFHPESLNEPYSWKKSRVVFFNSMNDPTLSCEPLIGPLSAMNLTGIDWVIVGGESGYHPRPMKPEWVIDIKDQCEAAGVPFFFKQWRTQ